MTLAAALRHRVLLTQAFGMRKARVRRPPLQPARFPTSARLAYVRGLLEIVELVRQAIARHVLPQLPRLVAAYAATQHRTDAAQRRIAIVGAPRAGKTTNALRLGEQLGLVVHHSDDLIALGWSEASDALAEQMAAAESGIFEGVAVVRALRKLLARGTDKPVDQVLVLRKPHLVLTAGQQRMAAACETVLREIIPALHARGVEMLDDPAALAPMGRSGRTDAPGDSVSEAFDLARNEVAERLPKSRIALLAQENALRVDEHVKGEVDKQIKRVVSVDVFAPNTGVADHLHTFVSQQLQLVQNLTDSAFAQTHAVVLEGLRGGLRAEEIAKNLNAKVGLSKTKATIIANDQVGKLNGELTRVRQTSLGIKRYKWATSRDELVRPTHRALDGTVQSWANPPLVNAKTGLRAHPGFDTHFYPCRCSGIPILDDLLEEAGLEPVAPSVPPQAPANDPGLAAPKRAPTPEPLPPLPAAVPRPPPANIAKPRRPARAAPAAPPPPPSPPDSPPHTPPSLGPLPGGLPQPLPANAGPARQRAGTNPKPAKAPTAPPPLAAAIPTEAPKLPADVQPPTWMTDPQPHVTRKGDVIKEKGASESEILTFKTPDGEKKAVWKPLDLTKAWTQGVANSEAAAAAFDRRLHGQTSAVVPPTVARELGGRRGSLQEFVQDGHSAKALKAEISVDPRTWASQPSTRKMFLGDVLTRNIDRHAENVLFTRDAHGRPVAHAIDNGYSFRTVGEHDKYDARFALPHDSAEFLNTLMDFDAASIATIQAADPAGVAELLRAHGVEYEGIRETLVRLRSLQKNPAQLKALIGSTFDETQLNLSQWLGQSAEAHGLTEQEAIDLANLAEGPELP